ncbi:MULTISPECIES: TolC family protein [unclassified Methylophaga]|jgi:outer membrane protein TolC|uniref:TolC family protein n=2 Tax=Methylophaga TaxID=40222 RepID=UPI00259D20D6|nr:MULTISPECIES: TolC family protein [unclassified Methylophaga]|tara:strand:+ start:705 stop:2033 length:1329 start_codon:yes stop_codon:yes gene_type:complete
MNRWNSSITAWLFLLPLISLIPAAYAAEDTSYSIEQTQAVLPLDIAITVAEQSNPGLAQRQARAEAMSALPSQLGSLPDPMISMGLVNLPTDSLSTSQEAMTQWQLGISQEIPFPGKLALKQQAATERASASAFMTTEYKQQLIKSITSYWWQLFYLEKTLTVISSNKTLLKQFIDIAETKYRVGHGLQQDVLLAQLELSKLLNREIELNSQREQLVITLNTLLSRPTHTPIQLPDFQDIDTTLPDIKSAAEILHLAKQNRPFLQQQKHLIAAAAEDKALAEKNVLPDFKVSAAYGLRQGNNLDGSDRSDMLSLQVGINVPLFAYKKQKMAISQKNSELKQQQFAYQDSWNQVQAEIANYMTQYEQARQQYSLLNTGILPQARQTIASMLSGYQVNKVDFLNLVRAQITLYDYETQLWLSVKTAKTALANLKASVGKDTFYE